MLTSGMELPGRDRGTAGATDGDITSLFGVAFTTQLRSDGDVGAAGQLTLTCTANLRAG